MVSSINKDLVEQARKALAQFFKDHEEHLKLNIEWSLDTEETMKSCLNISPCDELSKIAHVAIKDYYEIDEPVQEEDEK